MTTKVDRPLSVTRGAVLYIGALLGPGLLLLPGLAVSRAGPSSIVAWVGLLLVSGLLAVVFSGLGVIMPSATGVRAYADAGIGEWAGRSVGWCFLCGIITGAPIVCVIGGDYIAELLHGGRVSAAVSAAVLLTVVVGVTQGGLRLSSGVQLGLVGMLVVVVLVAVATAAPHSRASNWTPFAPHGWTAIGSAASVLMFSFIGWEAIAPLTIRFRRPRTQLPQVIAIAFVVTSVLYVALAAITVASLGRGANTAVPLEALLRVGVGRVAPITAALAALLLTLGCTNAYLTGATQLARSLVRRGLEPDTGADRLPRWLIACIGVSGAAVVSLSATGVVNAGDLIAVPTVFFLTVYLGCTTSAVRLLRGPPRAAALVTVAAVVIVLGFSGLALLPAGVVVVVVAALTHRSHRS
ncbi:MAG: APC family permease [Acidimicrobiales bacterium]